MPVDALSNDPSALSPAAARFAARDHALFIDGRHRGALDGATLPVVDPTCGREIARVPAGGAAEVDLAVRAARRAFDGGPWPGLRPNERERLLLRLADLLAAAGDEFSQIESLNTGRALANTRAFDVDLSVDYLRYMAGWATKIHGQTITPSVPYIPQRRFLAWTLREPVGVVGAITPWNVPLGQAIWKIAPALATGCTLVLKPAEQTPLTALRFAELAQEAGLPDGVLNVVTGDGPSAGAALVAHPGIDKLAFTGSTEVGRLIAASAGAAMKKYTLELGGKSPVIVLADADPDLAIPGAAWAIFGNHGENCLAGSRLLVQRPVYERIVDGVAGIARSIRLGPPFGAPSQMGPLISTTHCERVTGYVERGVQAGARVLAGGRRVEHSGCYVEPTVLVDVRPDMQVMREEIFGPVVGALPFDTLDEAVAIANGTEYGLGASVWTRDLATAHSLIPRLRAGTVWINAHTVLDVAVPFGGLKHSGMGHELGEEAIRHHTQLKAAWIGL